MSDIRTQAVIVVDVQADFTQYRNGALAVPGTGPDYLEQVVARTREFKEEGLPILATRDYHPADHVSFFTSHPGWETSRRDQNRGSRANTLAAALR